MEREELEQKLREASKNFYDRQPYVGDSISMDYAPAARPYALEMHKLLMEYSDKYGYPSFKEWQRIFKFKESIYDGWKKTGGHKIKGLALRADYKLKRDASGKVVETPEDYWNRVRLEISNAR